MSAALLSGMCLTASAFKYPSAYWKLHDAWAVAIENQDLDQVIDLAGKTYDLLMPLGLCAGLFSILGNYLGSRCFTSKGASIARPIILLVLIVFFIRTALEMMGVM